MFLLNEVVSVNTNTDTNTNTNTKFFAEEVVLGNRVLSQRWSDQSALRVKVSTAILEVKQSESNS